MPIAHPIIINTHHVSFPHLNRTILKSTLDLIKNKLGSLYNNMVKDDEAILPTETIDKTIPEITNDIVSSDNITDILMDDEMIMEEG